MYTKITLSRNLLYLVTIILAFITAAVFIWLWYDLNLQKLDAESQRLEKTAVLLQNCTSENLTPSSPL